MSLGIILFSLLFAVDNKEFLDAVDVDLAKGMRWSYVGAQAPPVGSVYVPMINQTTGEEVIIFSTK
jgi:hypothetical protein